ncbi:unnamed protein product [Phytomonas sp. Hart1]|nr:unnamed protein product [Phytomonas sp. Hart1]|eukprot:CCW71706.1 unnamed protein product [Phytomonas sp. isolate Hart1]
MRFAYCRAFQSVRIVSILSRGAHSLAAVQSPLPPTTERKLGFPPSREEVANVFQAPLSILDKLETPRKMLFAEMNLTRTRYAPLIATITADVDFRKLERQVAARFDKSPPKLQPFPDAFERFRETQWKDMTSLLTFYEEVMYYIRLKDKELKDHELSSYYIKDVLKRGLAAFKQDFLDQQKEEYAQIKGRIDECVKSIKVVVEQIFDTALCNDIANILRIGGEKHVHAHDMCLKVLNDMTMMKVPYDDITHTILRTALFNDGPFDDSPLLFDLIESPERGAITLSKEPLTKVSNDILGLISKRHQTPLDDGVLLNSTKTFPNLQRSPE